MYWAIRWGTCPFLSERVQLMNDEDGEEGLSRLELRILRHLQENGRLTNADLAKMVNISPATCYRRTQKLFDGGYITSVRAMVAPEKVNRNALVFVGVVLDRSTRESFSDFEAAIRRCPT
jgi:Lrp/AsnC family leucine-responsive transcriptional regulator